MLECDIQLTFTIAGPFLSRSSTTGGYGIDAVPLRDGNGRPVVPGPHVRGRIREALEGSHDGQLLGLWQMTNRPEQAKEWIGPVPQRDDLESDDGLRRFSWHFGDFVSESFCSPAAGIDDAGVLTRIALDDETGSVKSGAMQVIESAVPTGESAEFMGTCSLAAKDETELADAIRWLVAGARCVPSLGSFRNVGFGRVQIVSAAITAVRCWNGATFSGASALAGVAVSPSLSPQTPRSPSPAPPQKTSRRILRVTLVEPFCVGGKRRDRNTIQSLRHLPGAVLKGAVAHVLQNIHGLDHRQDISQAGVAGRWALLCRHFSGIRFCTAFPANVGTTSRPLFAPQSMFKLKIGDAEQVRDAARIGGPFLVKQEKTKKQPERWVAPAFSPDWKSFTTPGWDAGMAEPDVELRIRTAIDSAARRVRDEHLFAMEMVQPGELCWLGAISLEGLPLSAADRDRLWDDLESLLGMAVLRIGKTKARAAFALEDPSPDPNLVSCAAAVDGHWVIVLQSPALLADPKSLHDQWAKGIDATADLYAETFSAISGGALKLIDHFADQQLHGGFLAVRGRPELIGDEPEKYEPLLATEAGSVFVLAANEHRETDAQVAIEQWLQTGLPLPDWVKDRYGEDFQTNPFLPQDGFGEIAVNVPAQLQLSPATEEIRTL